VTGHAGEPAPHPRSAIQPPTAEANVQRALEQAFVVDFGRAAWVPAAHVGCPVIMKRDPDHVAWTCRHCGEIAISRDLAVRPA